MGEIAADSPSAEAAWQRLREPGPAVAPYLLEAYPQARRWQGRTALVFHAIRFARVSEAAYASAPNHHYFVDTQHSGRSFWVVNETDRPNVDSA